MENTPLEFDNSQDFSDYIETYCKNTSIGYIDAIIEYCKDNFIDIEDMKALVHPVMKEKIRAEAIELGMIKEIGNLDF